MPSLSKTGSSSAAPVLRSVGRGRTSGGTMTGRRWPGRRVATPWRSATRQHPCVRAGPRRAERRRQGRRRGGRHRRRCRPASTCAASRTWREDPNLGVVDQDGAPRGLAHLGDRLGHIHAEGALHRGMVPQVRLGGGQAYAYGHHDPDAATTAAAAGVARYRCRSERLLARGSSGSLVKAPNVRVVALATRSITGDRRVAHAVKTRP